MGLRIVCVNSAVEFARLDSRLLALVHEYHCDDQALQYDRPTAKVSSLLAAGAQTERPFLLINSDCQIFGQPEVLWGALAAPQQLTIGVRYNHAPGAALESAECERWGLDAFVLTPAMAKTLPALPFGIGKPMWDYWIPHHFRERGVRFRWIHSPFFFHETHALGWTQAEWDLGAAYLATHYQVDFLTDVVAFRRGL